MANELLLILYSQAGLTTVRGVLRRSLSWGYVKASDGSILPHADTSLAAAQIPASDAGHLGEYTLSLPSGTADGDYLLYGYDTAGTTPAEPFTWEPMAFRVVGGVVVDAVNVVNGTGAGQVPTAVQIAAAVLDVSAADHATAGTVGKAITDAASGDIFITPILATTTNPRFSTRDLPPIAAGSQQSDAWTITDATGTAVSLAGKTVRLIAYTVDAAGAATDDPFDDRLTAAFKYETGGDGIVISGDNHNVVTVTHDAAKTATAGDYRYFLWSVTDLVVLAKGKLPIIPAVLNT